MKIWLAEAEPCREEIQNEGDMAKVLKPGMITEVGKDRFSVQTGQGVLTVLELQIPGKKRMDAGAFLRGCQIKEGEMLGA